MPPSGQPLAGAILTVGNRVLLGAGNCGWGPVPAATGSVASSPQPARATAVAARRSEAGDSMRMRRILKSKRVSGNQQGYARYGSFGLPPPSGKDASFQAIAAGTSPGARCWQGWGEQLRP